MENSVDSNFPSTSQRSGSKTLLWNKCRRLAIVTLLCHHESDAVPSEPDELVGSVRILYGLVYRCLIYASVRLPNTAGKALANIDELCEHP
jgi:hypothetical protein